jgi:hypothetical protein
VAAERIARNTPGFQPVLGRKVRGFRGIKPSDTSHKRRPTREALVNAVLSGPRGTRTHNPRIKRDLEGDDGAVYLRLHHAEVRPHPARPDLMDHSSCHEPCHALAVNSRLKITRSSAWLAR